MPVKTLDTIYEAIREIEDYPEKGVIFRDITPLLQNSEAFHNVIDIFLDRYKDKQIDCIVGLDARGFIFGPILAYELNLGFVPIRKKGKLPAETYCESYKLEYGDVTTVEVHKDAINNGARVLIIDDLIATGGTMLAACKLINRLGGNIHECAVVINLSYLKGADNIRSQGVSVYSILEY